MLSPDLLFGLYIIKNNHVEQTDSTIYFYLFKNVSDLKVCQESCYLKKNSFQIQIEQKIGKS